MKRYQTNIIVIVLLLLAASPYVSFFIQEAARKAARHEMEERLEQGMLHSIKLNKDEIKWAEKGKEAWINGRLFDIKSSERSGDFITLTGLYDDEETMIVKKLVHEQQRQNASGNKLITGFFQLFGFAFTSPPYLNFEAGLINVFFSHPEINILSPYLPRITPPPRFA